MAQWEIKPPRLGDRKLTVVGPTFTFDVDWDDVDDRVQVLKDLQATVALLNALESEKRR